VNGEHRIPVFRLARSRSVGLPSNVNSHSPGPRRRGEAGFADPPIRHPFSDFWAKCSGACRGGLERVFLQGRFESMAGFPYKVPLMDASEVVEAVHRIAIAAQESERVTRAARDQLARVNALLPPPDEMRRNQKK
jgi:hypothetical protein